MKTLIIAAALLALTTPAFASEFRKSDQPTIDKWLDAYTPCTGGYAAEEFRNRVCKDMPAIKKKLIANGYCVDAHGGVGKQSKDRKRCRAIDFPTL